MIIGSFTLMVSGLVVFIVFASRQKMDLVSGDYYQKELAHQQEMDRELRSLPFAGQVNISFSPAEQSLLVRFDGGLAADVLDGSIELYSPADASADRSIALALDAQGQQRIPVEGMSSGKWKADIRWRTPQSDFVRKQTLFLE